MKSEKLYIAVIAVVFIGLAVVFDTFPRSTFSELEKRPLKQFPEFTLDKLMSGTFTSEVSSWFSDSEPFRDRFMSLSMELKDLARITTSQTVTFHAAETKKPDPDADYTDDDDDEDYGAGEDGADGDDNVVVVSDTGSDPYEDEILADDGDDPEEV